MWITIKGHSKAVTTEALFNYKMSRFFTSIQLTSLSSLMCTLNVLTYPSLTNDKKTVPEIVLTLSLRFVLFIHRFIIIKQQNV